MMAAILENGDPELAADFTLEVREQIISLGQQVVALERDPGHNLAVHGILRGFHTIKGLAGFLELAELQSIADEAETVLHVVREGKLQAGPEVTDAILESVARMNRVLCGLPDGQLACMATRTLPIGQLFQRTEHHVQQLAKKAGKPVEVVVLGEGIEVDKTIAAHLASPLLHMVRNAIDHGIESPEVRERAGKPARACITLSASQRARQIVIEISDDGRGMDPAKIQFRARAMGLVVVEDGTSLCHADVLRLILAPGFSTAEQLTDLSGRGVGMDVVREQLEKLRGRLEIRSEPGAGTTFQMKLPVNQATVDGLVIKVGGRRYIVPLFAIRDIFRPTAAQMLAAPNGREMAVVRGRLLPVVRLYQRLGLTPRTEDPCRALLIVAESQGQPFCLMADELIGKQEVGIQSGDAGTRKADGGRGGVILDVNSLWGDAPAKP